MRVHWCKSLLASAILLLPKLYIILFISLAFNEKRSHLNSYNRISFEKEIAMYHHKEKAISYLNWNLGKDNWFFVDLEHLKCWGNEKTQLHEPKVFSWFETNDIFVLFFKVCFFLNGNFLPRDFFAIKKNFFYQKSKAIEKINPYSLSGQFFVIFYASTSNRSIWWLFVFASRRRMRCKS